MARIINDTFVTLDGVFNHMDKWHFDHVDDESDEIVLDRLSGAGGMLMGRQTYDIYASAWPGRDGAYADLINAVPKYVVSSTLTDPTWQNATVVSGDLVEFVRGLDAEPDRPILMHGFGPVAKTLAGEGLLDELHLWFHPCLVGLGDAGDRLHTDGLDARFELIGNRALTSGVVILSYRSLPAPR